MQTDQPFDYERYRSDFTETVANEALSNVGHDVVNWSQSKKTQEFMKVVCLAHECVPEFDNTR